MNSVEFLTKTEDKPAEAETADAQTDKNTGEVDAQTTQKEANNAGVMEDKPKVTDESRKRGFQERINQLTAKYKTELEERDARIKEYEERLQNISQPKKEDQSFEFDTVDDLKKYIDDQFIDFDAIVEAKVSERLKKTSEEMLKKEAQKKIDDKLSDFAKKIQKEYSELFDEDIFIGNDESRESLHRTVEAFQRDPDTWYEFIQKNGVRSMEKVLRGELPFESQAEKVEKIIEKSEKAVNTKSTTSGVKEVEKVPSFNRGADFLRFFSNKK